MSLPDFRRTACVAGRGLPSEQVPYGAPTRLVLPPAILPPRTLCRKGTRSSLHWAVGCRLASVGRVAPAGTPHRVVAPPNTVGTDYLAYWTHCCFDSVLWFGILSRSLSLSLSLAPLRSEKRR
ncbi:hypothetical protein D4764_06G0007710 [Takifugu flavidus]|uniref:Uncharacterized protein n=1 Tax=Takifugu flavidus TaxID=433684 RepID=A0A5C6MYT1_9TELE|nr:hypothetical protein D4764_06G0007710 [Takifugu flavidus]